MLPKYCRLSLKQIKFSKSAFKVVEHPFFRLYLIRTNDSRGAVVVSKKQLQKSVDRNLIKRRFAAVMPELLKGLLNISIVVWIKRKSLNSTQEEIKKEIANCLKGLAIN